MPNEIIKNNKIRNVAIIAHVDHGKTTLIDAVLKYCHVFRENEEEMNQTQILDTGELEREKTITIKAKNISVKYDGYKINIIDTPGHADFGGEVERTLNMAEGCILLVDAQEGPMIQTRVVLKRALEIGLIPIVIINKIDKKLADIKNTCNRIQDLFLELAVNEKQLEFPILFAIGREGKVFAQIPEGDLTKANSIHGDIKLLLDTIIKVVPETSGDADKSFQMQISSLDFDEHLGRYLIGKIKRGIVSVNDSIILISDHKKQRGKVQKLLIRDGINYKEIESASVGEIIAITGIDSIDIGATLCDASHPDPLPRIQISPPSIEATIEPNTSPFAGRDGKFVTASFLRKRLEKEGSTNVNIRVETSGSETNRVLVRGEFQLAILIETMRREGYEFQVRKPTVICKDIDGVTMEPLEELNIIIPEELLSIVMNEMNQRDAEMINMQTKQKKVFLEYNILTRNLLGLRNLLSTRTKGSLIISSTFQKYIPYKDIQKSIIKGKIVSSHTGVSRDYSLNTIQERGKLLITSGIDVYEGMIIGINKYEKDLEANPTRERKRSAVRMSHSVITLSNIREPMELTLDAALALLSDDELLEVTPKNLRLRKLYLSHTEREWSKRKKLTDFAKKKMGVK